MTENEEKLTLKEYFILVLAIIVVTFALIYYIFKAQVFHAKGYIGIKRQEEEEFDVLNRFNLIWTPFIQEQEATEPEKEKSKEDPNGDN